MLWVIGMQSGDVIVWGRSEGCRGEIGDCEMIGMIGMV